MNSLDRFFSLSPIERAAHYRDVADLMCVRARSATVKETQEGYAMVAAEWLGMAEKLEAEHGKACVIVQSELACRLQQGTLLAGLSGAGAEEASLALRNEAECP